MSEFWEGAFFGYMAGIVVTGFIFSIAGKWIDKMKEESHD